MDDEILARLDRIERRIDALEARPAPVHRQPVPPVYHTPTPPPPPQSDDLESLIGSRWLPRAGALAIVAALAYLVAIGLQRGWITPAMVVAGIAVVCFGVIGLGMRLRDEREAFGHVLVGLGGGLYVDAVGAHLYQGVVSSEGMVLACLGVSLAVLGYGFWRALPAFLGIGLSGGLVAALMPLAKGGTATSAGLLIIVAVPAFAVAGGRRWPLAVVATWGACFLASLPILFSGDAMAVRLLPLDAMLLLTVGAWAFSGGRLPAFDPRGSFPFVAASVTSVSALGAYHGAGGAAHVAGLGVAVGLVGLSLSPLGERGRGEGLEPEGAPSNQASSPLGEGRVGVESLTPSPRPQARETQNAADPHPTLPQRGGHDLEGVPSGAGRRVALAGLATVVVVAPFGFPFYQAATILAVLALVQSAALRRRLATFVAAQVTLAVGAYGSMLLLEYSKGRYSLLPTEEGALLGLLVAASVVGALVVDRREARVAAGVAVWGLATRLALLTLGLPDGGAVTVAWTAVCAGLFGVGFLRRRPELRQLGLAVAGATAGKVVLFDLAGLDAALKAAVLLGLGLVLLGGGYAYVRARGNLPA